jgi:hypothetical protein
MDNPHTLLAAEHIAELHRQARVNRTIADAKPPEGRRLRKRA